MVRRRVASRPFELADPGSVSWSRAVPCAHLLQTPFRSDGRHDQDEGPVWQCVPLCGRWRLELARFTVGRYCLEGVLNAASTLCAGHPASLFITSSPCACEGALGGDQRRRHVGAVALVAAPPTTRPVTSLPRGGLPDDRAMVDHRATLLGRFGQVGGTLLSGYEAVRLQTSDLSQRPTSQGPGFLL